MNDFNADVAAVGAIEAVPTILEVICRTTGMRFAAVARVTEDRWIACQVRDEVEFGLKPGDELKVQTTICDEIRDSQKPVVIDHVAEDPQFACHHTPAMYGFQSYLSMPILLPDRTFFGTLCALDPRPARLNTPEVIGMFRLFAELIGFHLQSQRRLLSAEAALRDERRDAELREQFIAVLGHDLRNPLASVNAACRVLLRMPVPEEAQEVIGVIQKSSARMAGLIDNVTDFARGRLGDGLPLTLGTGRPLQPMLEQVVAECRSAWPDRTIEAEFNGTAGLDCDPVRMGQLLSNLMVNALAHGDEAGPVRVKTARVGSEFRLSVSNRGPELPPEMLRGLFKPFFRAVQRPNQQGLGLGLYVASEIARAHGGELTATSSDEETRFVFSMTAR
ncbi:GAF domain-containing sensor histidine kinase [Roseomonas aerophila]|uniref:histidine kinase n=1 Tax=Teichococcus aerophilus TaxID=1224513 RepID=A0ABR7RH54_9PROT|nr:GAF domain-containing sensor histidine kinase [Pseudoroseomonas aerophila]MBC9205895.1 GAF domain-containing sensor histidine kinase [Pseudoroseomonas aerophila]